MATGFVFENNKMQAVSLPAEMRFPEGVKRVTVRVVGLERVLSPVENTWDSFFLAQETVSDNCMTDRSSQHQTERDSFDD